MLYCRSFFQFQRQDCLCYPLHRRQPFWQKESYDHIVRSQAQFDRYVRYIAENPVKAKLRENEYQSSRGNPAPDSRKSETGLSRLRSRFDNLFTYTEEPHKFTDAEVATLITAIDEIKILDPACGSGAFPMGALHKLVYILGKLDPGNDRWKQTQLAKLDSAPCAKNSNAPSPTTTTTTDASSTLSKIASTA